MSGGVVVDARAPIVGKDANAFPRCCSEWQLRSSAITLHVSAVPAPAQRSLDPGARPGVRMQSRASIALCITYGFNSTIGVYVCMYTVWHALRYIIYIYIYHSYNTSRNVM